MKDINLLTWFGQRELDHCPKHFIKTNTPLTDESHLWILQKLHGRYHIVNNNLDLFSDPYPCFEDPQEAILYELTWS